MFETCQPRRVLCPPRPPIRCWTKLGWTLGLRGYGLWLWVRRSCALKKNESNPSQKFSSSINMKNICSFCLPLEVRLTVVGEESPLVGWISWSEKGLYSLQAV